MQKYEVVVIGGGIAGLTAVIYAAKAGKKTIVIEKQDRLGGRAMTHKKKGAYFNLGGHALFFGDAYKTFRELGLDLQGNKPPTDAYGIWKGRLLTLPTGMRSLLATPLLTPKAKLEFASWFVKLGRMDTYRFEQVSLREWVEGNLRDAMLRHVFYSLLRTSSYVAAPDLQAAGPVLRQLKSSLQGVLYLDRGWGTAMEQLAEKAAGLGVKFATRSSVVSIDHQQGAVRRVLCEDGTSIETENVLCTASPAVACKLVPHAESTALHAWKEQAVEVTAACLDVALRRLPNPKHEFLYGIDEAVFLSNHSRAASLSDEGDQMVSVIKYQGKDNDPEKDLRDLENTLNLAQPGWRDQLTVKQYLPRIVVCHDFMHIRRRENPGPAVPEIAGLYVAGDWASHGELLADAATASAKRAVAHLISRES